MKGNLWTATGPAAMAEGKGGLARWEAIAVDAVGNVIEFWGFKRNQGRVWALLYLRDEPMSAQEIEKELALSKGGVSMLVRDLERWAVIARVREPGESAWLYRAETDLIRMATRVVEERELAFITRIRADLDEARRLAEESGKVAKPRLQKLNKMISVADAADRALRAFIKTTRLDVAALFGVFK
jgi:HTH-type transcriptional regulator, glycine betaine synthesis regulator